MRARTASTTSGASASARSSRRGRGGVLRSVEIDGRKLSCDLLVMSGGRQPAYSLLAQAGARVEYDPERGVFIPTDIPDGIEAVGSVAGEGLDGAVPAASYNGASGKGKCFVCVCEDVTDKDLKRAIGEGFDSIELAKRYTTVTMGPCQGRLCHVPSIRLYARENEKDEATIGTTTARPPWAPVTLGLLAGRPHEPAQRTSIHHRHKELGAKMMWTGTWRRPHSYGDPEGEAQSVHDSVGVIDVSTLGKMIVRGPDAAEFLERLYPNRFGDMKPMRIRYGVLNSDAGRIMDDGTIARLDDETFYVTTTSTGAGAVLEWFEWWNAVWGMDVEIVNVTGALAAVNVAGPRARAVMRSLTGIDLSNEGLSYLDARDAQVAGVPSLILRIGFVGELGYELHFPSPYGEHVWNAILQAGEDFGIRPFGLEPQRILRLEKMHILVGQDTDSESNVLEASMPWIAKLDKDDFVGKWSLEHVAGARAPGPPRRLRDGGRQGAARRRAGRPRGHAPDRPDHELALEPASFARRSGWPGCPPRSPRRASRSSSPSTAGSSAAHRAPASLLRSRGREAPLVSDLAFLSPGRASAEATWRSPLERALQGAPPRHLRPLARPGRSRSAATLPKSVKGGELVRITPNRGLVLCDFTKTVELLEKLSKDHFAIDVSASLAGLSVRGEAVMRRITDLDLDALPAAGAVSHVQAIVTRDGDSFALWFAQEYSDYLAEVVIDARGGAARR